MIAAAPNEIIKFSNTENMCQGFQGKVHETFPALKDLINAAFLSLSTTKVTKKILKVLFSSFVFRDSPLPLTVKLPEIMNVNGLTDKVLSLASVWKKYELLKQEGGEMLHISLWQPKGGFDVEFMGDQRE